MQMDLPEGCRLTQQARNALFAVSHVTRDAFGNYRERAGILRTDIVCNDSQRVCIQYEGSEVVIDVPAIEIVISNCIENTSSN